MTHEPTPFEICHHHAPIALQIALGRRGPENNIAQRLLEKGHQSGRWEELEVSPDRLDQAIAQALAYKDMGSLRTESGKTTFVPTGIIPALYAYQRENGCSCLGYFGLKKD